MTDVPAPGMAITHLLVVRDLPTAVVFYRDVLGASLQREYGGTSDGHLLEISEAKSG